MRRLMRLLGVLLAAAAFVAVIIDGSRSIALGVWNPTPLGEVWARLDPDLNGFARAEAFVTGTLSPWLWDPVILTVLKLPLFAALLILALAFFYAGRVRRDGIGYPAR